MVATIDNKYVIRVRNGKELEPALKNAVDHEEMRSISELAYTIISQWLETHGYYQNHVV
jgi:uncharacterized protein YozE (UPF0346 family)